MGEIPKSEIVYVAQQNSGDAVSEKQTTKTNANAKVVIGISNKSPSAESTESPSNSHNAYKDAAANVADAELMALRQICHALYDKYIRVGAVLEGNISYPLRQRYKRLDESHWDMDRHDLTHVFDDYVGRMFEFMKESYIRYNNHR